MSDEEFDQLSGFVDLCEIWHWPSKVGLAAAQRRQAREAYMATIGDAQQAEAVMAAARRLNGEQYGRGLAHFIRSGYESYDGKPRRQVPRPAATPIANAAAAPPPVVDTVAAAFARVWPVWPRNEEYPEREAHAESFWRTAATRMPLEDLEAACMHYVTRFNDPARGATNPKLLKNLLQDVEALEDLLEASRRAPRPRELSEARAAYAAYPDFPGKAERERDASVFYRRHVKPEDRFDFLLAAGAYRREREAAIAADPESARFTKAWTTFVAEWWAQPRHYAAVMAVVRPLFAALTDGGLRVPRDNDWLAGALTYWVRDKGLGIGAAAARVARRLADKQGWAGAEPIVARTIDSCYVLACKRVGVVLESESDASGSGIPVCTPPAGGMGG